MTEFSLTGRQILIVEDEFVVARSLARVLQLAGATIVGPAATLERALDLVEAATGLDGAVIDINLQGTMAYPVADRLSERAVPFLFTTGYEPTVIPQRYAHVQVLQKPYSEEELETALAGLAQASRREVRGGT